MKRLLPLSLLLTGACAGPQPTPPPSATPAFGVSQHDPAFVKAADDVYRQDVSKWLEERGYSPMSARLEVVDGAQATALLKDDVAEHPQAIFDELALDGATAAVVHFEPRPDVPTKIVHVFRRVDDDVFNIEVRLGLEKHITENPDLPPVPTFDAPKPLPVVGAATLIPAKSSAPRMVIAITDKGCANSSAIASWLPGLLSEHGLSQVAVDFAAAASPAETYESVATQLIAGPLAFPTLVLVKDGAPVARQKGLGYWRTTNFLRANGWAEAEIRWVDDYRATPNDREAWLRWLSVRQSLEDGNFTGLDLSKAVLREASFARSVLNDVDFSGADLRRVSFRNADLTGAKFSDAWITGADFDGATCPDGKPAKEHAERCGIP